MTGANTLLVNTCSVSGQRDQHVGGDSLPSHSASRRAVRSWLSSSHPGSNCRGGACRSSLDPKSWSIARPALEMAHRVGYSRGLQQFDRREAGKSRALAVAVAEDKELEQAKLQLLGEVLETGRGLRTTAEQRAVVEEKLVAVEKFDARTPLELDQLDGTWLLQYTTAPDVVQILQASETPFLKVGQIFQKFECKGRTDGGVVRNVVRWSIPGILQDDAGATLVVTAEFSVVSSRSIALSFEEAQLGQVEISDGLQAFLAPAVLPRTFLNLEIVVSVAGQFVITQRDSWNGATLLQVLQFFRTLNVRVPLVQSVVRNNVTKSAPVGLWYYLTYLDRDMLVGRALGNGGIFVFSRTQQLQLPQ